MKLWLHLQFLPESRLTKRVFMWDMQQAKDNKYNWSHEVLQILDNTGYSYLARDDSFQFRDCESVLCDISHRIREASKENWNIKVNSTPKLRTYAQYKRDYDVVDYIRVNMPKSMRSTLAKFRCGVYPLAIEIGRYSGKPVEQRVCLSCSNDKVEDEFHFLLLCPAYKKERTNLLTEVSHLVRVHVHDWPSNILFPFLLT